MHLNDFFYSSGEGECNILLYNLNSSKPVMEVKQLTVIFCVFSVWFPEVD